MEPPSAFVCPVSFELMRRPVRLIATGKVYDETSIADWFALGKQTCPATGQTLTTLEYKHDEELQKQIDRWVEESGYQEEPEPERRPASRVSPLTTRKLMHAARHGNLFVIREMQQEGFLLSTADKQYHEFTALHYAAQFGHQDVMEFLLSHDVDVNQKDTMGLTPLHIAAFYGMRNAVRLLLNRGANPNIQDKAGSTPLHLSARKGHKSIIITLLENDADKRIKDYVHFSCSNCLAVANEMTDPSERRRKKSLWKRQLVLEDFDVPTAQSWYQRRLGHVRPKKRPLIAEADTFPIGRDYIGDHVWSGWVHHQLRVAIVGAVRRADWPRALALLVVYFKKVYGKTRTFRFIVEPYPLDGRFPTAELLVKTLSCLEGGSEVAESFLESTLTDQECRDATSNCLFYYTLKTIRFVLRGEIERAQSLIEQLVKQPSRQKAMKAPNMKLLRTLILYGLWHEALRGDLHKDVSIKEIAEGRTEMVSADATRTAQSIWSLLGSNAHAVRGISTLYIHCHVAVWQGLEASVLETLSNVMSDLPLHNDMYVLGSAVSLRRLEHHAEAMGYLLGLLKSNPHEGEALKLLMAETDTKSHSKEKNWTAEYIEGLLVHLDVCHPDCSSVQHCCDNWRAFLVLLGESTDDETHQMIHSRLSAKIHWWRVYFFSPFAVRSLVLMHGRDQVADLLCLLAKAACHLIRPEDAFLHEVKLHLNEDQCKALADFCQQMSGHPLLESLQGAPSEEISKQE